MLQEILNIWKKLNENNVRYLTIGGLAVNIYGYSRNTGDIDILIEAYYRDEQCNFEVFDKYLLKRLTQFNVSIPISIYHLNAKKFDDWWEEIEELWRIKP